MRSSLATSAKQRATSAKYTASMTATEIIHINNRSPLILQQHGLNSLQASRFTDFHTYAPFISTLHSFQYNVLSGHSLHRTNSSILHGRPQLGHTSKARSLYTFSHRQFSTESHSRSGAVHAVTGYAFAGKPRTNRAEEEMQRQYAGNGEKPVSGTVETQARQGFPKDSIIGAWVDATLKNGEAGEDALLYQKMKGDGDMIIGVADGVGGWSENGIDPALFSQSLLYHAADYAKQHYACPERIEVDDLEEAFSSKPLFNNTSTAESGTPLDVLQYAFDQTQKQTEVPAGSATACLVSFDATKGVIRTANLGDSGFLVLRPPLPSHEEGGSQPDTIGLLNVHYQSKPQTHGFNTPLQLSKLPPEYRSEGSIDSKPSNADLWSGRVLDGDIVLVATDGFWDNVSVNEVLQLVKFIQDKHRAAFVDRMLDISSNPLAEEEDLADVLANK
jgi:protein phosphatase PTC7